MPNKKLVAELRELIKQRGMVSEMQREYAKSEENAMTRIYPIPKPCEEKRFSHLRTLKAISVSAPSG